MKSLSHQKQALDKGQRYWFRLTGLLGLEGTPVVASISDDPQLRAAWLEGLSMDSPSGRAEAAKIVCALEKGQDHFVEAPSGEPSAVAKE